MSAVSWLLIETERNSSVEIIAGLKKLGFVKKIDTVRGEYQIIARATAENFTLLDRRLSGKIRSISGIRRITVLPVLSEGVES